MSQRIGQNVYGRKQHHRTHVRNKDFVTLNTSLTTKSKKIEHPFDVSFNLKFDPDFME